MNRLLCLILPALALLSVATPASAAISIFTVTFQESYQPPFAFPGSPASGSGSYSVSATGSGSFDISGLTGLTPFNNVFVVPSFTPSGSQMSASVGGGSNSFYQSYDTVFTGPALFGTDAIAHPANGVGGPYAGADLVAGKLYVPAGYTSGSNLTTPFANWFGSLSALGLSPGNYSWTYNNGSQFNINIIDAAGNVPEPGTTVLGALAGLTFLRRRRR